MKHLIGSIGHAFHAALGNFIILIACLAALGFGAFCFKCLQAHFNNKDKNEQA